MPRVVVAGSENDVSFAVIDFTNPGAPTVAHVNPGFGGGCRVTLEGSRCYAGSVLTGDVTMVDVSTPAAPVQHGRINTTLSGIGALAGQGHLVAVGEWINNFQARVTLIDFSNPAAPAILGTAPTPLASSSSPGMGGTAAISSLAFIAPGVVVAAGPTDPEIVKVDFTNPGAPVVTSFLSGFAALSVDANTTDIAAGDQTGPQVKLFDAATNALVAGPIGTLISGITSLALAYPYALLGSTNESRAFRLTFAGAGGTTTPFTPSAGGGFTTAADGTLGACGEANGTRVTLIDLSQATPAVMGAADPAIGSIGTLSLKTFGGGGGPMLTVTPATPLAFGVVRVGSTRSLTFTLHNAGGSTLTVSNLVAPARYSLNPPGPFSLGAGASQVVTVTFSPNAEATFNGTITMTSNDPAHPHPQVQVTGTGGLPHISVTPPGPIDLGAVPVCESSAAAVTIHNTGAYQLTVTGLTPAGPGFSVAPAVPPVLVVPGNSTRVVTVRFAPSVTGNASGTLTVSSDDTSVPTVVINLTGNGLPEPPPDITVAPNPMDLGPAPIGFFVGRRLSIANTGLCEDLTVNITCSGPPFFVTTGDPTTVPTANNPVPATIPAGHTALFAVIFAPTATGPVTPGSLSVTSNAGNSPTVNVQLTGTVVPLSPASLELVLDRSGSMAGTAPGGTKMDALHAAVHLFADLTPAGQGYAMGSVQFDDAIAVLTPFASYDTAQRTAIEAGADGLAPRNATSIGGGIHQARAELAAATGRKVMIVFTDGMENTPPMIAGELPGVLADGIEAYAVGLGQPQNISSALLAQLAATSGGRFFQTDDTLILRKDFVEVLVDAFRQNMAVDPVFSINAGDTVDLPVLITECEARISFVVNWDDPASLIDLSVISPGGTVYTPASPSTNQLVRYAEHPGYRLYQIAFPPLDPGSGQAIGPRRTGTWRMRLHAAALTGARERCTTSVFVQSDLTMRIAVASSNVGAAMTVRAQLIHDGAPLRGARAVVTLASPTRSLAATQTPPVLAAAMNADVHPIPSNRPPRIGTRITKHRMAPDKEVGYIAQLPTPKVDGVYHVTVEAIGPACGGIFQRYASAALYVGRRGDKPGAVWRPRTRRG